MGHMKTGRIILRFFVLMSVLSGVVSGQNSQSPKTPNKARVDSLKLPSFSIFGLSPSKGQNKMENLLDPNTLENFLVEVEKGQAEIGPKEYDYFWIIPMVFHEAKSLFDRDSWTTQEVNQGQLISDFFARLAKMPDLKISKSDQKSFRTGLVKLRNWFASLCQDNKTLASMIFTMDDGPFFGKDNDSDDLTKMKVVESVPLAGKQASFVLMTDGSQPEPMIIGVLNKDKSVRWIKRFSNSPNGRITQAELQKPAIYKIAGYGYVLALMTNGSSGIERSRIYLDESLNLRFYYVSW